MRRAWLALAAVGLAGCGATTATTATTSTPSTTSPTGSPATSSATSSATSGTPSATPAGGPAVVHVRVLPGRLPTPVAREAVFLDGQRLVVAGGLGAGDTSTGATYSFDPSSGQARPGSPLPVPVHDVSGVAVVSGGQARDLVLGGGNASEQDVVQERMGNGRWQVVAHLPQARSDLTGLPVDGGALVLGGYDGVRPAEPDILASPDGRTWQPRGRLPVPVRYAAGAVAGGNVWLFGGEVSGAMQAAVQRVSPDGRRAAVVAHLPTALGHSIAVAWDSSRILLLGGRTGTDTVTDRMWWFDTATLRFTPAGRLPFPLADAAVVALAGTQYVVGGETPALSDRVLALTP